MQPLRKLPLLLLAAWLGLAPAAQAERDRDRDRDRDRRSQAQAQADAQATANASMAAPLPGTCSLGSAERDLDVNNVSARAFNTGSLFFGSSSEAAYIVPQTANRSPIFAAGIWIGGRVDTNGDGVGDQTRFAGARYANFQFWPGPLNPATARPVNPSDCSAYDRIWKVSKQDILDYEGGANINGTALRDLREWPWQLGAPVIAAPGNGVDDDSDGTTDEGQNGLDDDGDNLVDENDEIERRTNGYDLAAGDRPEIIGDQALWWVMNDVGATKTGAVSSAMGMEVQVLAFSFDRDNALGNTTFYRYRVIYRGEDVLMDTYLSVFTDPDLGNATDDYVASDTALSMGIVYNADNNDETSTGYGSPPPAIGLDFFQGPIVNGDTLGLTGTSYFINGGPAGTVDPATLTEYYNYQQGLWGDGVAVREGGTGRGGSGAVTRFAFPGDPVTGAFWTEENTGVGGANTPGDRRLVVTTGPFTMQRNDVQDIVFGIVFAQGTTRLSSISALRAGDRIAQAAYDVDFEIPSPPPAPPLCEEGSVTREPGSGNCLEAIEISGTAGIQWGYPTNSENYLGQFTDGPYEFEGFNVYRYPSSQFNREERELVATYDIANGITFVNNIEFDPTVSELVPRLAAQGTDNGLQYQYFIENATNYTDVFLGVTAYAVDQGQEFERVIESSPSQIVVRPSNVAAGNGGTVLNGEIGEELEVDLAVADASGTVQIPGVVTARVVNPTQLTGHTYRVVFRNITRNNETITVFDIVDATANVVKFNGEQFYDITGDEGNQQTSSEVINQLPIIDGLQFTVTGALPQALAEFTVKPGCGDGEVFHILDWIGGQRPIQRVVFRSLNGTLTLAEMEGTVLRFYSDPVTFTENGTTLDAFTEHVGPGGVEPCPGGIGCATLNGDRAIYAGNIATTPNAPQRPNVTGQFDMAGRGVGPNDPGAAGVDNRSPRTFELRIGTAHTSWATNIFATNTFGLAEPVYQVPMSLWDIGIVQEGAANDPSDDIQMVLALINDAANTAEAVCRYNFDAATVGGLRVSDRIYGYYPGGNTSGNDSATNTHDSYADLEQAALASLFPAFAPGVTYEINTTDIGVQTAQAETAAEALEAIAAVPNPYLGRSTYESGNEDRVIRFTNMPDEATIRIYTISGTLVKTLFAGGDRSVDWNLETENNLPVASGMYLVHVEVPGVGERVLRLGVVNRQTQLDVF